MGKESLSLESQEFGQNQVSDDMLLSNSSFQQLSENTILLSGPYSLKARELCQILPFFFFQFVKDRFFTFCVIPPKRSQTDSWLLADVLELS